MSNSAKFSLYIVVILLLAISVLWFIGGAKQEYSTKVSIGANPSRVYRYLSDPDLLNEWSDEVLEIEPYESDRRDVGALAEVMIDQSGQQVAMRQQIIKYERDKMISLQRTNDFLKSTAIFRLEENNSKTELTYRIKESRLGFNRVLGFFKSNNRQELIKQEIRQLKQVVESNLGKDLGERPRFLLIDEENSIDAPVNSEEADGDSEDSTSAKDAVRQPADLVPPTSSKTQQNRPDQAFSDQ